jgi:hypothetical protein
MTQLINADGRDVTQETLAAIKKVMGDGQGLEKAETVATAQGLVAYDLEAPSKNLYPVLTPLRNRIPRRTRGAGAGDGAHWKEVSAITGGGVSSMPWIPEGQRAARMSLTTADKSAAYVTLGEEADVTFEAQSAGEGFEDVMASTGMRLLHSMMIKEEFAILGGDRNVALGKPDAPTVTVTATGGSIDAGANTKVRVRVFALTLEGYLAATLAGGIKRQVTVTGMDAKTFTLNGGSSKASDAGSADISGSTNIVAATVPVVKGAVGYAWFVELGGASESQANSHLEAITTINSINLTALNGTYQALNASGMSITSDYSNNVDKAFDGLLYIAYNSALAYYLALATGTAGAGTGLTASGRGSVDEIDTMLEAFWSSYRLSPEEIYVNAQELRNISTKAMTASGGASLISIIQPNQGQAAPQMIAGNVVGYYFNPFSLDGGQMIPIKLHPNLPPGTIFTWAQNLPGHYQAANVPETCRVQCRRDYYQIPWPLVTRANETGVYAEEVLMGYAPFALGILTNIGDA